MFSFTKKSFSFKVYITGNREFLPLKPQICLIHSSKLQDKFSVSHCEIQKPQCGIYISQCGIQILQCETENRQAHLKEYFRRKRRIVHLPRGFSILRTKKRGCLKIVEMASFVLFQIEVIWIFLKKRSLQTYFFHSNCFLLV